VTWTPADWAICALILTPVIVLCVGFALRRPEAPETHEAVWDFTDGGRDG
jgi:hypothetical protein